MTLLVNIAVAALAVLGLYGVVYGATSKDDRRRKLGLRLCQGGMSAAGLILIAVGLLSPDHDNAIYGLLFLVFGTGVTAVGARRQRNG